jgi:uncharacterized protein with von Willebrand factor type A (vWA) domain
MHERAIDNYLPSADIVFLDGGFHGGTDLRPALDESLRVMEQAQFSLADVVVISDFRIPCSGARPLAHLRQFMAFQH